MSTIFALSSGAPPAAIALLRLSGPGAFDAVAALTQAPLPPPRTAVVRSLRDPASGMLLDKAIVLLFPGPRSATGEDIAELHLHGGRAVVRAVEHALAAQPGLSAADPGEFTRRALVNGRIDLTQAEALGDLLAAETERQRRQAVGSADGRLRRLIEQWNDEILALSAMVEAVIDHGDEDDLQEADAWLGRIATDAMALAGRIDAIVSTPTVERLHNGITVVLAGPPNSGKSSLVNALVERDVSIVSNIRGTTRDKIEAHVQRKGVAWIITDTAGLVEHTSDMIEAIGINLARSAIDAADIVVWMGDGDPPVHDRTILVHSRADVSDRQNVPADRLAVSAVNGQGIESLWLAMEEAAAHVLPPEDAIALNERQHALAADLASSLRTMCLLDDPLLAAEELRSARACVDALTGRAGVEEMLDALFGRFCIGK